MAAILITDCTVAVEAGPGFNIIKIVTPATADDADTIDCSDYFTGDQVIAAGCQAATDGWDPIAAITTAGVLTIPGATDNEARTIQVLTRYQS